MEIIEKSTMTNVYLYIQVILILYKSLQKHHEMNYADGKKNKMGKKLGRLLTFTFKM